MPSTSDQVWISGVPLLAGRTLKLPSGRRSIVPVTCWPVDKTTRNSSWLWSDCTRLQSTSIALSM